MPLDHEMRCQRTDEAFTIVSLPGLLPALLVAEDEVDPVMKMTRHMVTLKCRAQLADEILRIWKNP